MGNLLPSVSRSIYPTIAYCNNTFQPKGNYVLMNSTISLNPKITINTINSIPNYLYTNSTNTMSYLLFGPYFSTVYNEGQTLNQLLQTLYPICYPYMNFVTINGNNFIYVNILNNYAWANTPYISAKTIMGISYPAVQAQTSIQNAISAISSYIPFTQSLK